MRQSIKSLQSEFGATGEHSPNLEFIEDFMDEVHEKFQHVHDTVTGNDCMLFIANMKVGETYNRNNNVFSQCCTIKGCDSDVIRTLSTVMGANPHLIPLFAAAIQDALDNLG